MEKSEVLIVGGGPGGLACATSLARNGVRVVLVERKPVIGPKVCAGGILGMGETETDRARLLQQLANLKKHPESVPINDLVRVEGTPLAANDKLDALDFIRTIAVARILMPQSYVRLSAGRTEMSDETQAWCFFAGANSMFYGDRLLTTDNPDENHDMRLFARLGIEPEKGVAVDAPCQSSCAA